MPIRVVVAGGGQCVDEISATEITVGGSLGKSLAQHDLNLRGESRVEALGRDRVFADDAEQQRGQLVGDKRLFSG